MKKLIGSLVVSGILLVAFQSFILKPDSNSGSQDEVKEILKNSCYGCHSNESSNKKGMEALNFDQFDGLKATKKISKLDAVNEVVTEGKMPPEKFLKGNPDKALSDEQKTLLGKWAVEESEKLMNGN
ncbi:MAG: heme-binding domain-containing protein [Bacteroides sp.]|nr:heme-binding domain-containing protein [Bacteroides sp.]